MRFYFVITIFLMGLFGCTPVSRISSGDKNYREIEESRHILSDQLADLKDQVSSLQDENEWLSARIADDSTSSAVTGYRSRIINNNILINMCNQEIIKIQQELSDFLLRSSGKDSQTHVEVFGSPEEVTNTLTVINYYKSNSVSGQRLDSAIVINQWHQDVYMVVLGPGGFRTATLLRAGQKIIIKIPGPGNYSVSFGNGRESKKVSRYVNCLNYDTYEGRNYSFLAFLPAR